MAQQNQDTIPVHSGSFPPKRKRGRPRKYDDPGYEPRRRFLQSSPNLMQGGSSQSPQLVPTQPNPTATLGHGSQSLSVQFSPATPIPGNQVISRQVTSISLAGVRPHSLPFDNNFVHSPSSGLLIQNQTPPSCTPCTVRNSAQPQANQTAGIPANFPQARQSASSSHDQQSLIGQAVSGILDGTFDAGYLLTVRVGSTGEVLKGLVFDPRLCIPISEKNDIAPLLPVASPRGNLCPLAEAPVSEHPAVPTPVAPKEPALPFKSTNHEANSEFKEVCSDDKPATQDACHSSLADTRDKTFQTQTPLASSLDYKSEQPVIHNEESERPSTTFVANQELRETAMATGKLTETVGVDGSQEQTIELSGVDSSGGCQQNLQQIDKQTENLIKELEDQEKHPAEDKAPGTNPISNSSNELLEFPGEPKCSTGEQTLTASGLLFGSSSQVNAET